MWKDEFLHSITGEIVTTSRSLKNLYALIIRLLCQLFKIPKVKQLRSTRNVRDSLEAKCVDARAQNELATNKLEEALNLV